MQMKKILLLLVILNLIQQFSFAQNKTIDSLFNVIKTTKTDTVIIYAYLEIAGEYIYTVGNFDSSLLYSKKAIEFSQRINFQLGIAKGNRRIGQAYDQLKSDYSKAIIYFKNALKVALANSFKSRVQNEYRNIGYCYGQLADFKQAIEFYNLELKTAEELKDESGMFSSYIRIGSSYKLLSNFPKALEYQLKGLQFVEKKGSLNEKLMSYYYVGEIYNLLNNYSKSLEYYKLGLKTCEENPVDEGTKQSIAKFNLRIAEIYSKEEDYLQSINFIKKSLDTYLAIKDTEGIGLCYSLMGYNLVGKLNFSEAQINLNKALEIFTGLAKNNFQYNRLVAVNYRTLGNLFNKKKDYEQAIKYLDKSIKINNENNFGNANLINDYSYLANSYEGLNNYKKALYYYKQYWSINDSLFGVENNKKISDLQSNFNVEKKEIELNAKSKVEEEKIKAIASAESKKQKLVILFVSIGLIFLFVFAGYIFRSLRISKGQNKVIEQQRNIVQHQNKDILDSIEYAKRIQATILPPPKVVKKYLEDSFILYLPKDIVAGDFYWMESPLENENVVLFAACDCTGHGVPGALVSVVCSNALNRTVKEFNITQPAKILDKVAELVVIDFSKDENENVQDGMDASLCALNTENGELEWAGANNPIWIIRNGELMETKANKQPIGKYENMQPFTNHNFSTQKGDTIYLITDGYADQFGGDNNKKLGKAKFKTMLLSIQHLPLVEQRNHLYEFHNSYRGANEQVDDILIIGVKV